jgi:uncharacterized membrane protein
MTNDVMDFLVLLMKTLFIRPYVFLFLAAFLFAASRLLGWPRAGAIFGITWLTAYICEFSSTRIGIPFGRYYYTGSTVGQELYLSNVPVMDTLSFTFLLFASYAMALWFLLPADNSANGFPPPLRFDLPFRTSWSVVALTVLFYAFIDIVIDPVALQGERWFLGRIYGYPEPGLYFGVPIANFIGWAIVGTIAMIGYIVADRRLPPLPEGSPRIVARNVLLGCALYYGVLAFNLAVTFWIGERLLGMTGVLIYLPITALFLLRLFGRLPLTQDIASLVNRQ